MRLLLLVCLLCLTGCATQYANTPEQRAALSADRARDVRRADSLRVFPIEQLTDDERRFLYATTNAARAYPELYAGADTTALPRPAVQAPTAADSSALPFMTRAEAEEMRADIRASRTTLQVMLGIQIAGIVIAAIAYLIAEDAANDALDSLERQ